MLFRSVFHDRHLPVDREILSLHPCPARCGARHRCGLCGFGRCRARSSWRALFTASRTGLSSPPGPLGRIRGRFPRWPPRGRRARLQSPFGLLPTRPPAAPSVAQTPQNPHPSRPRTVPPRSHPPPLAASYRRFLTTIDTSRRCAPRASSKPATTPSTLTRPAPRRATSSST